VAAKVSLSPDPGRNLALELVRATEAAAMAAARQPRRGDKEAVDTRHHLGKSNLVARPR
jgi:Bacterial fructose-1,6-bisphosphatase, glpX-encoded